MKKYIHQVLQFLLLALPLSLANRAYAMQPEIFEPTGKEYGSQGWNYTDLLTQDHALTQGNENPLYEQGLHKAIVYDDIAKIEDLLSKNNSFFPLDQPSVLWPIGRAVEYLYPIECAMRLKISAEGLETILKTGLPINDLKGYNPLKQALDELLCLTLDMKLTDVRATQEFEKETERLEQYITLLIHYGASPHNSQPYYGVQISNICTGTTTAYQCLNGLISHYRHIQQNIQQNGWTKLGIFRSEREIPKIALVLESLRRIKEKFDPTAQPAPVPQRPTTTTQQTSQISTASTAQLGQSSASAATSKIFEPTGKEYYSPGWRVVEDRPEYSLLKEEEKATFLRATFLSNPQQTEKFIQDNDTLFTKEPWIITSATSRCGPFFFRYSIEEIIRFQRPITSFNALLVNKPQFINGFPDYNPLKDILERLINPEQLYNIDLLKDYAESLIDFGIDLDTPFPAHTGYGPDTSSCNNCSARQYIALKKNQVRPMAVQAFNSIARLIDAKPPRQQAVPAAASPKQVQLTGLPQAQLLTASTASTSQIPQQQSPAITTPTAPAEQPRSSWQQWCAQTTSPFAKKTICAFVLGTAAAAIGAKMAYKRWVARRPVDIRIDLKLTVKNNIGTKVQITVRKSDDTETVIPLDNHGTWSGSMIDIAKLSITPQDAAQPILPINLTSYAVQRHAQDADLEITLVPVTGWWQFWYRSPYNYEAKWQKLTQ
jgi:hypothetical protein